jgi:hypothetical protein
MRSARDARTMNWVHTRGNGDSRVVQARPSPLVWLEPRDRVPVNHSLPACHFCICLPGVVRYRGYRASSLMLAKQRKLAMKSRMFSAQIAVIAFSAVAALTPARAQAPGQLFAFHSGPNSGCPGLDWHLTLTGDDLEGFVAWDRGKHMARLEGKLIPAAVGQPRSFKMDAQEVGAAARKATVEGTAQGQFINAMINGSGTACDGKILQIPRVAGGMGGGGG